jgi:hypothetical protein
MRGEGAETGHIMWSTLSMVAASERNLIVQRLTAGLVAKYRRGEWIRGSAAIPLGYRLDGGTKNLAVDPGQAGTLVQAFTLLADPQLPMWKVAQALADAGVTTHTARKRYGPQATVADFSDPETFLRQLLRWAPTYRTGRHVTRWPNPFHGAQHIAGMPVVGGTEEEPGHLSFEYDWGRPDVPRELIDAALAVRARPTASTGAAGKRRIPPLNGVRWFQDGLEYQLRGARSDTYEVRMRSVGESS